jgi:hypothetical protein
MTAMIIAIDIGTITGIASGRVGSVPTTETVRFGEPGASVNELFCAAAQWIDALLEQRSVPDLLILEELLPPLAKRGFTNTGAQHRLAGLHGVIRGLAQWHGVPEIASATVGDIRGHFIGERGMRRAAAKRRVMEVCRWQGFNPQNDNEGDALALWSYGCALIDPKAGLDVTPLFGKPPSWADVAAKRASKR